jgi:hypothetical protein
MDTSSSYTNETFFPVSSRKLVVMSFCTLGLYQIYWLYQNWRIVKYREQRRISPPWRSVLGIFFLYPMLRRIRRKGYAVGLGALPAGALFSVWLLLTLLNYSPDPLHSLLAIGSVFALVPVQRTANAINQRSDPELQRNDKFSKINLLAIVLVGPLLVLSVVAQFLTQVQT